MSVCPGSVVKRYLGIVDIHIIKVFKAIRSEEEVPQMIEQAIVEINEMAKAKVEAIGGNCLLSLKMDITTLEHLVQS